MEAERQKIAARFSLVRRIGEPLRPEAQSRSQARRYAARNPRSTLRLHAQGRSQARRMRLETPVHPLVRAGIEQSPESRMDADRWRDVSKQLPR